MTCTEPEEHPDETTSASILRLDSAPSAHVSGMREGMHRCVDVDLRALSTVVGS